MSKVAMQGNDNNVKMRPIGFSFTVLFFTFLPMLIRGDFKIALRYVIITSIAGAITLPLAGALGFGLHMYYAMNYNRMSMEALNARGYYVS